MRGRGATLVAHRVQTTARTNAAPGTEPERQRIAIRGAHLASAPERRGLSTTPRDPKHCRLRTAPVKSSAVALSTAPNVFPSVSKSKTNALRIIASKDAWVAHQSRWFGRAAAAKAGPPPHRTAVSVSQATLAKKPGSNGKRNARGGACGRLRRRAWSLRGSRWVSAGTWNPKLLRGEASAVTILPENMCSGKKAQSVTVRPERN